MKNSILTLNGGNSCLVIVTKVNTFSKNDVKEGKFIVYFLLISITDVGSIRYRK